MLVLSNSRADLVLETIYGALSTRGLSANAQALIHGERARSLLTSIRIRVTIARMNKSRLPRARFRSIFVIQDAGSSE